MMRSTVLALSSLSRLLQLYFRGCVEDADAWRWAGTTIDVGGKNHAVVLSMVLSLHSHSSWRPLNSR